MLIVSGVLLLHAGALWALQAGLVHRVAEVVIPAQILSQFITPLEPAPLPPPPRPIPPAPAKPTAKAPLPAPRPRAIQTPAPPAPSAPEAPAGAAESSAPAPVEAPAAPDAPSPASNAASTGSAPVLLPTTDADYAENCKPVYPSASTRLGEYGRVIVHVVVEVDGRPGQVNVKKSSGFPRLDAAAREAMQRCRFIPGKVNGVAQRMPYDVPVNFVLD